MRFIPYLFIPFVVAIGTRSFALEFEPAGSLRFAPNAVMTHGFERVDPGKGLVLRESPDALEGTNVGVVDSAKSVQLVEIPLTLPAEDGAFKGRLFVRNGQLVALITTEGGTLGEPDAVFFPTGRVTSDGWYEIETAPFTVQSTLRAKAKLALYSTTEVEVDAFEVVQVGPGRTLTACAGADDPVCGVGAYCAGRICHDGALGLPPLPAPDHRTSVVDYLKKRVELFFGGRLLRETTMPAALVTMDKMKAANDSWSFWNGFAVGLRQLRDWHTKVKGWTAVEGCGSLPVCFVEGEADLSHSFAPKDANYPDILVSHVGPEENFGLKAGDRLVAVNGVHPVVFMDALEAVNWETRRANDPSVHADKVELLRWGMRRWAKDFTIIRCDPQTKSCSAPEVVPIAALSDVEPEIYPECDHRPLYHLAPNGPPNDSPDPVTHVLSGIYYGPLAGTEANEGLWGMIWNDVLLSSGTPSPYDAPIDALRSSAKGVILDHRTGNGGNVPGAEYLTSLFRAPATLGVETSFNFTIGLLEATKTKSFALELFDLGKNGKNAFTVGSPRARADLKTALLLSRAGSASDYFAYGMRGAPNVRLFGRRTAGAFSSYLTFDYFGSVSFKLASGDFIGADGATNIGVGVQPDEEIVPTQSDLLVGRDTAHERALAWLRSAP